MKGDFIDFTKKHKLSEQECELVSMFRMLRKSQKATIIKLLLYLLMDNTDGET